MIFGNFHEEFETANYFIKTQIKVLLVKTHLSNNVPVELPHSGKICGQGLNIYNAESPDHQAWISISILVIYSGAGMTMCCRNLEDKMRRGFAGSFSACPGEPQCHPPACPGDPFPTKHSLK